MPLAPQKINPYIFFDWETGGLKAIENPVMELACIGINGVTLAEVVRYDNLVKPYDKKLVYMPQALAVNGLTVDQCEKNGVPLSQLMRDFCQLCEEVNIYKSKTARPILVAHNADFDRGFLQECARRTQTDLSKLVDGDFDPWGNFVPHVIDTIDWAKDCWAEQTENTTKFKMAPCCEKAGISFADGHRAINDTEALADLFRYFSLRLRSGTSDVVMSEGKATVSHRLAFEW